MEKTRQTTGWIITSAALGINLLLGLLYAWSVFKKALVADWGWSNTVSSLPYTFSAALFAFMMVFAGRAQDKFGPRIVALIGGLMFGGGLILSGFATNPVAMVFTFGVMGGIGIGLGYSATTPCAIKWFESSKKGLISGIVVSGVGLAPVIIAPLTAYFLRLYGIQKTFIILGTIAVVVISVFSLILRNPPAGYIPVQTGSKSSGSSASKETSWKEMLRTSQFYILWITYLLSATAGLMLIGHMASIASTQASWKAGYILVVLLSVFNASGRIAGGILSDKVGRTAAFLIVFIIQAVNMFLFPFYTTIPLLIIGASVAGLAYGSLFALFPSITADYFGVKNLGVNYGLVFTGWGIAGIVGPVLGGLVVDKTGSYNGSYLVAGVLLIVATFLVRYMKLSSK
ncbi:MAG TPA: OFA family MFS transporter [Chitinispirillaceae bacterium]|jgi:OFA family oxalate/formate antiporter-like MFS transporter|nr:OFA family MFS transporter [Chitinispirillaceae bacterium]